jgi:hypothetical protein
MHGFKLGPTLPRYDPVIVGTMPATYQLLPRARHNAITVLGESKARFLDPLDPAVWERMGWGLASPDADEVLTMLLPEITDAAARRQVAIDHLRNSLSRAGQFADAMDLPASPPSGTHVYLVAGDSEQTPAVAGVDSDSGKVQFIEYGAGDGSVLRSSALMDERMSGEWSPRLVSPIDWSHVTFLFRDHLDLTKSQEFTDNILFILLEKSR